MSIEKELESRSNNACELCTSKSDLSTYDVSTSDGEGDGTLEKTILICHTCKEQMEDPAKIDTNHWRCLNDCIWSTVPAVQVVAYRQLKKLNNENWAQAILDSLYLEPEVQAWAESQSGMEQNTLTAKDSNGTILNAGDTVTLIKDLNVKGAGFTAKRGTTVKGISLTDNPEEIEGRVNGVRIVLKTCFLKKA